MGKANVCYTNVCHAMQRQGDTVTERAVNKQAAELPTPSPPHLAHILCSFSGNSSFHGPRPLSKFCQTVKEEEKALPGSFGLQLSLAQSSPYTQVALSGETHSEPMQGHVRQQAFCACPSSDMLQKVIAEHLRFVYFN